MAETAGGDKRATASGCVAAAALGVRQVGHGRGQHLYTVFEVFHGHFFVGVVAAIGVAHQQDGGWDAGPGDDGGIVAHGGEFPAGDGQARGVAGELGWSAGP